MKILLHILISVIIVVSVVNSEGLYDNVPKSKVVKCAVCRAIVSEIHDAIKSVDPRKTVEVGSFRLDSEGKQGRATKKYAGSESHITDLLETLCDGEFKDYVQAKHKETNEIDLLKLVINGKMNPNFGDFELIQDPDLNKGVTFHCQSIAEDFEDHLITYFAENADLPIKDSKRKFCENVANVCPKSSKEEL